MSSDTKSEVAETEDRDPLDGITCVVHNYGPTVRDIDLHIIVDADAKLSDDTLSLIEKLARREHSLGSKEVEIFEKLVRDIPSLDTKYSINAQPLLEHARIKIELRRRSTETAVTKAESAPSIPVEDVKTSVDNIESNVLHFVPRSKYAKFLKAKEFDYSSDTIIKLAITGIRSSGKTELAKFLARTYITQHFPTIEQKYAAWFLDADLPSKLESSYKLLAYEIKANLDTDIMKNDNEEKRLKNMIYSVQKKLQIYPKWILVFDNVTNYEVINGFIPRIVGLKGFIIATANNKDIFDDQEWTLFDLNKGLNEEEAYTLLTNVSCIPRTTDELGLIRLAKYFDYLPHFLLTAALYIKKQNSVLPKERKLDFLKYLTSIHTTKRSLESLYIRGQSYNKTGDAALVLCIQTLSEYEIKLLSFCGVIDNSGIPIQLIEKLFPGNDNLLLFIENIKAFSLINPSGEGNYYIHRATQRLIITLLNNTESAYEDLNPKPWKQINLRQFIIEVLAALIEESRQYAQGVSVREKIHKIIIHVEKSLRTLPKLNNHVKADINLEMVQLRSNLAAVYWTVSYNEKSMICFNKAQRELESIDIKSIEEDRSEALVEIYRNFGNVLTNRGKINSSLTFLNIALDQIESKNIKSEFKDLILWRIAYSHRVLGNHILSEKYCKKVVSAGKINIDVANAFKLLSDISRDFEEYEDALSYYQKAEKILDKVKDSYDKQRMRAKTYISYAALLTNTGDFSKADKFFRLASDIFDKIYPKERRDDIIKLLIERSRFLIQLKRKTLSKLDALDKLLEANECLIKALKMASAIIQRNHQGMAILYNQIAILYREFNDLEKAIKLHAIAIEIIDNSFQEEELLSGKPHPEKALFRYEQALTYQLGGNHTKAMSLFKRAFDLIQQIADFGYNERHPLYRKLRDLLEK